MDGQIVSSIIEIIILLGLSAFFSATETAFTSLNRIKIKNLANDGNKKAQIVLDLTENYDKLLSAILVGNNLVNIAIASIATVLFVQLYGEYGSTVSTIVVTIVVLIFGEISPKSIAKEKAENFAMATCRITKVVVVILTPVNWLFAQWKKLLAKIFKLENNTAITEEELLTIVEEAETEGTINEEHSTLIQNAIEFNDLEAEDIMTPRVDMMAIDINESKETIAKIFLDTGYSRLPVYEEDMDNMLGILNQKDFHNFIYKKRNKVKDYVQELVFAPGTMKAGVLLKKMQESKTHMAIIVDEYGGTDGLVTLEDIIEELVGDIYDEHDEVENEEINKMNDDTYRIRCSTNMEKFLEYFDLDEELKPTTVNGWVVMELDNLPQVGDEFTSEIGNKIFKVKVTKADDKKAEEIQIKVTEKEIDEDQERSK